VIKYLSNGIDILTGDDPVLVKFGPKGTDPQQEGCAFHVSHAERCALGVSRPSCSSKSWYQNSRSSRLTKPRYEMYRSHVL